MAAKKVIVTVAPTGGLRTKAHNPNIPTQPEEIADDVYRCFNAGASIAALHARLPNDEATCDPTIYRRINDLIRGRCNIIINNSTGGGANGDMISPLPDGRLEINWTQRLRALEGGAEMCTLNPMTVVADIGGQEFLMSASPSRCREMASIMKQRGIKPEWEAFSLSHIVQGMTRLIAAGFDEPPYFVNLGLGLDRIFQGALPYSPRILQMMVDHLPPQCIINISAAGEAQLPATVNMLLLGGHVRVGLEDNIEYFPGDLATNVRLVERMVRIIRELGFEPASPAEARAIIGLPRAGEKK